jgi:hypothetical protein
MGTAAMPVIQTDGVTRQIRSRAACGIMHNFFLLHPDFIKTGRNEKKICLLISARFLINMFDLESIFT